MKTIKTWIIGLVLLCVAATVTKISLFTDKPNSVPVGTDFLLFQRNSDYVNSSVAQFQAMIYAGGTFSPTYITNTVLYTTNIYVTTQYVNVSYTTNLIATFITNNILYSTNIFVTNLTVNVVTNTYLFTTNVVIGPGGGLTNFNLTPSSLMKSDNLDAEASVPNGSGFLTNNGAGLFGWLPLSALQGAFIANNNGVGTNISLYGTNYFTEIDDTTAYLTNTTINALNLQTNLWAGPTNVLNLAAGNRQTYTSATATSITGLSNKPASTVTPVTLKLFNSAGTNWLLTLASTILTRDGARQYTCTNGQYLLVTVEYDPSFVSTNSLNAPNY